MEAMEEVQKKELGDQSFEHLIESEQEFNQMLVRQTDDYLIDLYHYLLEKKESLRELNQDENKSVLDRIEDMIFRLKEIPAIKNAGGRELTEAEKAEIEEMASMLEEKRAHNGGVIRRFLKVFRK